MMTNHNKAAVSQPITACVDYCSCQPSVATLSAASGNCVQCIDR